MLGLGLRGFTWGLFNELLGARVLPWQLQGQTLLLCRTVGWQQARVGAVEGVRKLFCAFAQTPTSSSPFEAGTRLNRDQSPTPTEP